MKYSDDILEIYFQKISKINRSNLIKKASKISQIFDLISSGSVNLAKALTDNNITMKDYIFGLSEQGKSVDDIAKHMKDAKLTTDFISEVIDIKKITKEAITLNEALISNYKKYSDVINSFGKGNAARLSDDLIIDTYKNLSLENKSQTITPILKRLEELKTELIYIQGNSLSSEVRSISETISKSSSIPRIYADYESRLLKEIQKRGITLNPDGSFIKNNPTSAPETKTPESKPAQPTPSPEAKTTPKSTIIDDDFDIPVVKEAPVKEAPKVPGSRKRKEVPPLPGPEIKPRVDTPKKTPTSTTTTTPKSNVEVTPTKSDIPASKTETPAPKVEEPSAKTPTPESSNTPSISEKSPDLVLPKSENKSPGEILGETSAKLDVIEEAAVKEPELRESVSKASQKIKNESSKLKDSEVDEYKKAYDRERAKYTAKEELERLYGKTGLKGAFKETMKEFLTSSFKTGLYFTSGAAVSGIFLTLGLGWSAIKLAAIATGCYYLYKYMTSEESELITNDISEKMLKSQIELVYSMLSNYTVRDDSPNAVIFNKTIESLQLAYHSKLYDSASSVEEFDKASEILDQLSEDLFGLLSIPNFADNLIDSTGYEDAAEEGKKLYYIIKNLKSSILNGRKRHPDKITPGKNDIDSPIGKAAPTNDVSSEPKQTVKVLNQDIDISKMSPQFRSAAPRLAEKVLNSREGKIFLDPDNIWGGWLQRHTMENSEGVVVRDFNKEYLEALKFLYLNKIFSRHDLAKYFRNNLSKASRKNHSGFKNALKHYK